MEHENKLTKEEWELLEEATRRSGKPRQELLRELVGAIGGKADTAFHQSNRRAEAFRRIDSISSGCEPDDGLSASIDHDEILYGGK